MSLRPFLLLFCVALITVPVTASAIVKTTPAPLNIYSITPSEGIAGSNTTCHILGTGFLTGVKVYIIADDTVLYATDVTIIRYGDIQCTFSIPLTAALGLYSLYVQNPVGYLGDYAHKQNAFTVVAAPPGIIQLPEGAGIPTDTEGDHEYDDINGNGRCDFMDVVLYFNQMTWITANEPLPAFDYDDNGRIDFADVVWLFNHL